MCLSFRAEPVFGVGRTTLANLQVEIYSSQHLDDVFIIPRSAPRMHWLLERQNEAVTCGGVRWCPITRDRGSSRVAQVARVRAIVRGVISKFMNSIKAILHAIS